MTGAMGSGLAAVVVVTLCVALGAARAATRRSRLARRLTGERAAPVTGSSPVRRLLTPPPWFAGALPILMPGTSVDRAWSAWLCGLASVLVVSGVVAGPLGAVAGFGVVVAATMVVLRSPDRRSDALVQRELPTVLEAAARSLRAGGSVRTALADAAISAPAPLADDLDRVVHAAARGLPLRDVIDEWPARRSLPGVRLAAAALAMGVDTGTGLARTLDGVAATLHERAAIEREVRMLATQARYSAGVLIVAPVAFLGLVAVLDPATVDFLVGTPLGLACLGGGLALDAAAGWWMTRICREAR
jgi:tight adherence protein B